MQHALRIAGLHVRDWRNVALASLETDAQFIVLHGENGQGKTNLLEAAWLIATLRSFRESTPARLVRDGAEEASVRATLATPGGRRTLEWRRRGGDRELRLDDLPIGRLEAWFGLVRAVLFCPEHLAIVRGGPAERRQFVDRAAFTASPAHLDLVREYARVVRQKGALLRRGSASAAELDPWDARLVELGARLTVRRRRVVEALGDPLAECHRFIAGGGQIAIRLMASGGEGDEGVVAARLADLVARARAEEHRQGQVLVGPHRDDLGIELDGRIARAFASQGQARSIVLALKLAELEAARRRGDEPLFLLDDLTSELDRVRMGRLVEFVSALRNQVWITTTDPGLLGPLPSDSVRSFRMREGVASRSETIGVSS